MVAIVKSGTLEKFVSSRRMPCILTDVRVALATSDVQIMCLILMKRSRHNLSPHYLH